MANRCLRGFVALTLLVATTSSAEAGVCDRWLGAGKFAAPADLDLYRPKGIDLWDVPEAQDPESNLGYPFRRASSAYFGTYGEMPRIELLALTQFPDRIQKLVSGLIKKADVESEYGQYLLVMKNGRAKTSKAFTSGLRSKIYFEDVLNAFHDSMARVKPSEIHRILFFHTHPNTPCLSAGDLACVRKLKELVQIHYDLEVPIDIFAAPAKPESRGALTAFTAP